MNSYKIPTDVFWVLVFAVTLLSAGFIHAVDTIETIQRPLSRETLNQALEQCSPNGGLLKIEVGLDYSTVTCHNNMTARIPNK